MLLCNHKMKCALQAAFHKISLLFLNKIYITVNILQFHLRDAIPTYSLERENNLIFFFLCSSKVQFLSKNL